MPIKKIKVEVTETKKVIRTIPVWTGFFEEQEIRWNSEMKRFELRVDSESPWEPMDWDDWCFPTGTSEKDVMNTLQNLLKLIKHYVK